MIILRTRFAQVNGNLFKAHQLLKPALMTALSAYWPLTPVLRVTKLKLRALDGLNCPIDARLGFSSSSNLRHWYVF